MATKLVNVRLPEPLFLQSQEIVQEEGYRNVQELMADTLREHVKEQKKQKALEWLKKSFGSVKPMPRLTKEQKEKIALEHTPERAKEIMQKYGFL